MKKICILLVAILMINTFPAGVYGESFGPSEWNQYRMISDKNAVYNNGSEPLNSQVYQTADEVRSTPVVVGNKLFVGNHNSGDLFAFDVVTGEELWRNKAPNWIHSEMIYQDDIVYVGFGNRFFQDNGIRGTGESGLLALDADSGDILWKYNTDGEVMPTPAYYDGAVYIATGDRHLYKLDSKTGDLLHKEELGSTTSMSSPNINDDTLFVGGSGPLPYTFSAYDLLQDDLAWQTEFPKVIAGLDDVPPAVSEDIVVTTALEGERDTPEHFMYALDKESGDIIWKVSLGIGEMVSNNKSGAPMIYEGKIYVGSPITKTFYAYDLETGDKLWEFENEVMKAPPVAQDGVVYFSNTKGFVYALNSETGEKLGEVELEGKLAPAGPIIINDTLFVGSQDTNVYAVPLSDFGISKNFINSSDKEATNGINYVLLAIVAVIVIILGFFLYRKRKNI
ncbi:PQQ-binding-like beta-propeller repeat protein [Oceanobacillus halophilus]|uniref:Pyrrolo-quinoline quinone repeat domain-containing protein n=1 Tax=Oceanobacillus halophilus TaxID=930130 RepID=A0A495A464_9BACI|nr:PQQ-binding-like beta-propeller repeat protein [Oceanobacillus halophilus]RKQ34307.1 hypothetical protein D8M06_07975 [Oceanobacillus halophilus]